MSETMTPEENETIETESFADLMETFENDASEDPRVGDKISGSIISIGADDVFVNIGAKMDGVVSKAELMDENEEMPYQVGDRLELYVVAADENGIQLSRAISGAGSINLIREAHEGKVPVQGKVRELCKGGFHVDILQHRAFCPVSHIDMKYVETPEDYVGQEFEFLVTRIEEKGRNIVVSRRDLILRERAEEKEAFLETLKEGGIMEGRVSNLMPYGAFVELYPGIEGMVHVSELSWSRVDTPDTVLAKDETVTVKVIGIEDGKKPGELKIALSMKQVDGDPWDREPFPFEVGAKVRGKVTRLADFGAFVEIAPGIEGLVHISEMSYKKRVMKPDEIVGPNAEIDVMIKDIDLKKRRVSLSIRDAEGDPWTGVAERYAVGQKVEGILEKKEKFGFFINLEPGVTGLLPKSKMGQGADKSKFDKLKPGETVTVVVEQVQPNDRKITLSTGKVETAAASSEDSNWKSFAKDRKSSGSGSGGGGLGSLGEKLQEALDKKR